MEAEAEAVMEAEAEAVMEAEAEAVNEAEVEAVMEAEAEAVNEAVGRRTCSGVSGADLLKPEAEALDRRSADRPKPKSAAMQLRCDVHSSLRTGVLDRYHRVTPDLELCTLDAAGGRAVLSSLALARVHAHVQ